MKKRVFNIKTDELGVDFATYIQSVYDTFIPDGKHTMITLKGAVSPWHKDLFRFTADINKRRSPYEMINDYVTEDISGFYAKIINRVDGQLKGYGERADKLRNQHRCDFEKSMQTTSRNIMEEIERCAVMQADVSTVIKRVNAVLEKRRNALQSLLESVYLQITRCVVLWKHEDDGYAEYIIIATGENCPVCSSMSNKKFPIKNLVPYENFPPFHPNCDCMAGILDEDGKIILLLDNSGSFILKNNDDLLEYAKFVLKKVVLGDFSDEAYTPDALALSIVLGTVGLDLPMDIRDLAVSIADITQNGFNKENSQNLALNLLAVLPAVGTVKYADDAIGIAKYGDEIAEGVGKSINFNNVIKNGKININDIKSNPRVFSGKSAEEFAQILKENGYEVIITKSAKSKSGAQIIKIKNQGNEKNISQIQISPGGGRHGQNPYVKISTTNQGIIKIVDGPENLYITDGNENATIIFSGGK